VFKRAQPADRSKNWHRRDLPPTCPTNTGGPNQVGTTRQRAIHTPLRDNGEQEAAEPQRNRQTKIPELCGLNDTFSTQAEKIASTRDTIPRLSPVRDSRNGQFHCTATLSCGPVCEHSKQARAPHTNGPRDVPRFGALSLLRRCTTRGVVVVLRPLFAAALVVRCRYLIVSPRPFPAAPLVVRRRCLIAVPRPMPSAPRMYLIVVYMPLPAAPLVVRCIYMAVVPGPMPATVASRCCRRRSQQSACACGS
jgi:hypothetical protein